MGLRFTGLRPADRNTLLSSCSVPPLVDSAIIPLPLRVERRNEG